jgi:CubicO group peptidase (beta-lactamase class C family)
MFPEKEGIITAELLLKHQSGIRHYRGKEVESVVHYKRVQDSFPIFQDDPLLFAPGSRYSYTTYGFNVLGAMIESASGQDYVRYVREHILKPANMETMFPDDPFAIIENRAAGYRIIQRGQAKELQNDLMVNVSNKIPGGGWCSTARDLVLFASALMDGRLLPEDARARMWTRQATATGQKTNSGLGCFLKETESGQRVSHSGGQPKVSTLLLFWPNEKTAIAIMCNLRNAKLEPLAERVHQRLKQTATSE